MALIVIERLAVMSFIPYTLKNTLQMTFFFYRISLFPNALSNVVMLFSINRLL